MEQGGQRAQGVQSARGAYIGTRESRGSNGAGVSEGAQGAERARGLAQAAGFPIYTEEQGEQDLHRGAGGAQFRTGGWVPQFIPKCRGCRDTRTGGWQAGIRQCTLESRGCRGIRIAAQATTITEITSGEPGEQRN